VEFKNSKAKPDKFTYLFLSLIDLTKTFYTFTLLVFSIYFL